MPVETRQQKNLGVMPPTTPSTLAQWSKMTNDVRSIVVGHLDYGSRCNMKLCSNNDYSLVNMTKFKANNIVISGVSNRDQGGVHIEIDSFSIWFIKKDNNTTEIERGWNGEKIERYKEIRQEDHYDLSRRFLDKYHQKFGLNATSVHIQSVSFSPSPNWKIKCDNFELLEAPLDWLNASVSRKYKSLVIFDVTNPVWAVDERMLEATDKLSLLLENDMTDEQLETVKATDVCLHSKRITTDGLIKYLDYFIKNGKETDSMYFFLDTCKFNNEQLMEFFGPKLTGLGLDGSIRKWMLKGIENVHGVNNPRLITFSSRWFSGNYITVGCYVIDDEKLKKIEEKIRKKKERSLKQKKNKNEKKNKTVKRKKRTQKKKNPRRR